MEAVDLTPYLSPESLSNMGELEKRRHENLIKNYQAMKAMGEYTSCY